MPIWKREHFEGGEVWLEAPRPIPRTKRQTDGASNCMRVTVRLFARLRDLAGTGELTREVPDSTTVQTLWRSLTAEMPSLAECEPTMSVAVNAEYAG